MPKVKSDDFEHQFNKIVISMYEHEYSKHFQDMGELVQWVRQDGKFLKIDWFAVDKLVGFRSSGVQAISYKHFMEVTIPNSLPDWPPALIRQVTLEMDIVTKKYSETLVRLFKKDKKKFVLERQRVMDEVVQNLNLKSYNYPLKRIVDKMRHFVTTFTEKTCNS